MLNRCCCGTNEYPGDVGDVALQGMVCVAIVAEDASVVESVWCGDVMRGM